MKTTITNIKPTTVSLYADDITEAVMVSNGVDITATISHKDITAHININLNNREILTIEGTNGQVPDYEFTLRRALGKLLEGL